MFVCFFVCFPKAERSYVTPALKGLGSGRDARRKSRRRFPAEC